MVKAILIKCVRAYQLLISSWIAGSCRFEPTCSAYAIAAIQDHGAMAGTYLAVRRIARCQPWCDGGCDPVPASKPRLFTWLPESNSHNKTL